MARQEATNIFSDGLMNDLHPINTPKSVLTDCLNGTYITYNGNEFILQNDMGNYKLKNCRLPVNFIPVGVKSYADILYIVSYSPITKEVEIGSYPAPQSIFTAGDSPNKVAKENDLAPFQWEETKLEWEYNDLITQKKKALFVFTDVNEETFKLNPGDEFKFTGDLPTLDFTYQHLNFYILDEDNKLYDLDDTLIYKEDSKGQFSLIATTMNKVFWETPGWLAAQYDLYVPDKFNLNIRSLNVPEFLVKDGSNVATLDDSLINWKPAKNHFKVSLDLSSQTIITDSFFQAELERYRTDSVTFQDLYIRYIIRTSDNDNPPGEYGNLIGVIGNEIDYKNSDSKFKTEQDETGNFIYIDIPCIKHNYQDDILTAYTNVSVIWDFANPVNAEGEIDLTNYKGAIELTAYPILNQNGQILKYTQFASTQRYQLNNLKNTNDINIANSVYKWAIDSDSLTISFNIDGPFINALNFEGFYGITKLVKNKRNASLYCLPWDDGDTVNVGEQIEPDWIPISNLSVYGQNTVNYTENMTIKEDGLYAFSVKLLQEGQQIALKHFLLIPSELFNEYFGTYDHYRNLTYNNWVGKYIETLSNASLNLESFSPQLSDDITVTYKWNNNLEPIPVDKPDTESWESVINKIFTNQYGEYHDTTGWILSDTPASEDKLNLYFQFGLAKGSSVTVTLPDKILTGNLWNPQISITASLKQNYDEPLINIESDIDKTGQLSKPSIEILTEGSSTTVSVTNQTTQYKEKKLSCPYYNDYNDTRKYYANTYRKFVIKASNGSSDDRNVYCNYSYSDAPTKIYCDTAAPKKTWVELNKGLVSSEFSSTFGSDFACRPVILKAQQNRGGVNMRITRGDKNIANDFSDTLIMAEKDQNVSQNAPSGIIMKAISNLTTKALPCYILLTDKNGNYDKIRGFLAQLATVVCYDYGADKTGNFAYFTSTKEFTTNETITVNQYNLTVKIEKLAFTENINWINNPTISVANNIEAYTLLTVTAVESKKVVSNLPLNQQLTISFDYIEKEAFQDLVDAINSVVKNNNDNFTTLSANNETNIPYKRIEDKKDWPFNSEVMEYPNKDDLNQVAWTDTFDNYFNKINTGSDWSVSNICYYTSSNEVLRAVTTKNPNESGKIDIAYFIDNTLNA